MLCWRSTQKKLLVVDEAVGAVPRRPPREAMVECPRERSPRREAASRQTELQSAPSVATDSQASYPYPFDKRQYFHYYVESREQVGTLDATLTFFAHEAEAEIQVQEEFF